MKFRNLLTSAALGMMLFAPQAQAQAPYQTQFWFANADGSDHDQYDAYTGSFTSGSEGFFQVFCVNPDMNVSNPDSYLAWVTPFTSADGSHTEAEAGGASGATFNASYMNAAKIASLLIGNYPGNVAWSDSQVISIQNAIWFAMGFGNGGATNYNNWLAQAAGIDIIAGNWVVISDSQHGKQEFITYVDTPFETVPEPATMTLLATGLAGMAAARKRRKS